MPEAERPSNGAGKLDRDEVLARLDVVGFYAQVIEGFKPNGKVEVPFCCPFHNDQHPSASVNCESGLWYCQTCGLGGSPIDFLITKDNMTVAGAIEYLANLSGLESPRTTTRTSTRDPLLDDTERLDAYVLQCADALWDPAHSEQLNWLREERLLSDVVLLEFQIGWDAGKSWSVKDGPQHPGGAFTIPLFDARDSQRTLKGLKYYQPRTNPKMTSLRGTPSKEILYGKLPESAGHRNWITEGEMDALALISADEFAVTTCSGAKIKGDCFS